MKKTLLIITAILLMFSLTSLICFAEEGQAVAEEVSPSYLAPTSETENGDSQAETTSQETFENENSDITTSEDSPETLHGVGQEENSNPFEAIYNLAISHWAEIFSAIACMISCILIFCYKKGIVPLLSRGISALKGGVNAIGEEVKKQGEFSDKAEALIDEKLSEAQSLISKISQSYDAFNARLEACESLGKFEESVKDILFMQIELLYEIFMNSSLPQFEKERIGEKVNGMKKTVTTGSDNA